MENFTFFKKNIVAIYILFFTLGIFSVKAQDNVGIGTNTPAPTALLDINDSLGGNKKGLLVPRLNTVEMNAIVSPANSLLIYNVDSMCYYFYRQVPNTWVSMCHINGGSNSQDTTYTNYSIIDSLFANYVNIDSLFASFIHTDSIFANYVNIDSLFASYIHTDSLFATYVNIDSLFASYIHTDSLFVNYANIDSLFANYLHIDSLFATYANIDSLFANYIHTDSIFATYATIDSLFVHFIHTDSLFATYATIDSLFANYIHADSLFATYAHIDSLITHYISTDSIFAHYGNFDSLLVNYLYASHIDVDSIFGTYASFDSINIHGHSIQSLIDSLITVSSSSTICGTATAGYVSKFTGPATICNSLIYDNGVNVGIGTTTPGASLHVEETGTTNCRLTLSAAAGQQSGLELFTNGGTGFSLRRRPGGGDFDIFNVGGLGTAIFVDYSTNHVGIANVNPGGFTLKVSGTTACQGNAWTSDLRMKNNIESLNINGLDIINQLHPVTFEWKKALDDGMKGKQMGFIAQEIEKTLPNIVITENDSAQSKAVKYIELLPVIVKAMQELNTNMEKKQHDLQEENLALKSEISTLKSDYDNRLKALEKIIETNSTNSTTVNTKKPK